MFVQNTGFYSDCNMQNPDRAEVGRPQFHALSPGTIPRADLPASVNRGLHLVLRKNISTRF